MRMRTSAQSLDIPDQRCDETARAYGASGGQGVQVDAQPFSCDELLRSAGLLVPEHRHELYLHVNTIHMSTVYMRTPRAIDIGDIRGRADNLRRQHALYLCCLCVEASPRSPAAAATESVDGPTFSAHDIIGWISCASIPHVCAVRVASLRPSSSDNDPKNAPWICGDRVSLLV